MLIVGSREWEREGDEEEAENNRLEGREKFSTRDKPREWGRGLWWNGRGVCLRMARYGL
jgi:hypothetical protein